MPEDTAKHLLTIKDTSIWPGFSNILHTNVDVFFAQLPHIVSLYHCIEDRHKIELEPGAAPTSLPL